MNHPAWIIIAGSSVAGLEFIGPFRDYNTAEAYYESQGSPTPWLVTALDPPENEAPSAEPVAWRVRTGGTLDYVTKYRPDGSVSLSNITPLYAAPEALSTECDDLRSDLEELNDYVTWLQTHVKSLATRRDS